MTIESDIQSLSPGSIIDLFILDLTAVGGTVLRFHPGINGLSSPVTWQGQVYTAMPVKIEDIAMNSSGQLARPKVTISNVFGVIGAYCRTYEDLIGAPVTRKRTFVKYLDAVNFPGGVNATADPTIHFLDDIFYVERKVVEDLEVVQLELASALDLEGISLPSRQFIQNVCPWDYRSSECSYAGGAVAKADDTATSDPTMDSCGHRLNSCLIRFGDGNPLPFGGFPATGLIR